jgi:NitT/TauT family transport system substrate-binding protein
MPPDQKVSIRPIVCQKRLLSLRLRLWLRRVASVVTSLALVAGALPLSARAAGEALKPVTITVGTQVINVGYPWLTLPIALGYWRDAGYDVKLIPVAGSLVGVQQMLAGSADFAQVNATALVQANTVNNVPLRGLMETSPIDWGVGVPKNSGIQDIKDLKGKKIGIFSLGTGGLALLKGYLHNNGLNPDTDVQIIATGGGAPALDALENNRVQALMFWGQALVGFENAGMPLRILRDPSWSTMPDFTFATLQKTVDGNPAMVEAISRGSAMATLFAETNPDCARRIQWKYFPSTKPTGADESTLAKWDLALLKFQLKSMREGYELRGGKWIGAMDPAGYGQVQDFLFQEKLIKRKVSPESMLISTPGFAEAINRFDHDAIIAAAKACKGF